MSKKHCAYCVEVVAVKVVVCNPPRIKFCVKVTPSNRLLPPSGKGNGSVTAEFARITDTDDQRVDDLGNHRVYQ